VRAAVIIVVVLVPQNLEGATGWVIFAHRDNTSDGGDVTLFALAFIDASLTFDRVVHLEGIHGEEALLLAPEFILLDHGPFLELFLVDILRDFPAATAATTTTVHGGGDASVAATRPRLRHRGEAWVLWLRREYLVHGTTTGGATPITAATTATTAPIARTMATAKNLVLAIHLCPNVI